MAILQNNLGQGSTFKDALSHVIWIGGATDAGKTSVTDVIAQRYGFQSYHYDRHEEDHSRRLAPISAKHRDLLITDMDSATLDARWVYPSPEELVQKTLASFQNRFPLALEDLVAMRDDSFVVAEGFGFTPDLLVSLLSSVHQAIWFVPTDEFKWASMQRRNKPYFREMVSDPERGVDNFFQRDMMLAELVTVQAEKHGFRVVTVDGSQSIDDMANLTEQYLAPYFQSSNNDKT